MASFDMAGFCFGPVLASVLYQGFGLSATFIALAVLLLLLVWPVIRTPVPSLAVAPAAGGAPLRELLRLRPVRGVLLCSLALYITGGVFEAIWAVFLTDRGASQLFVGATLSLFSLPMMLFPPFAGRLAQRIGPLRVVACGIGVAIPCMLAYSWLGTLAGLAVLVALHSVADSFTMPALQLGIGRASPPEHLATGQGLVGASGLLTAAIAALASGWVYGAWGEDMLFGVQRS
jgi:MFS family permease